MKRSMPYLAISSGFDSHDGFTRAFNRQFGITPQKYHMETPPVNWFVHYPIEAYYILKKGIELMSNEKISRTVTATVVERPARKLIYLRHTSADYFTACQEVGCDWQGFYNSIQEKFDTPAGDRLPKFLIQPGTNGQAFFVEVPWIIANLYQTAIKLLNCHPAPISILMVCRLKIRTIFLLRLGF